MRCVRSATGAVRKGAQIIGGCGAGLQAIQLARNSAENVHAIDLDPRADFEFFPVTEHFAEAMPQIEKVVAQSDAYLLDIGGSRSIVAYLLDVHHA